jgi:bacillithiol biosynthesis cysteine-adding enzyme BshC
MAESLKARNIKAVPIFWIASEDHDFEEVSKTSIIDVAGVLQRTTYVPKGYEEGSPVGLVEIDESIDGVINGLLECLPQTAFTGELERSLMAHWRPGTFFADAFAKHLADMLSGFGMVYIDPLQPAIKSLSAPIYEKAISKADEIVEGVTARSRKLIGEGYHAQVEVKDDYFPLFWHDDKGERCALRKVRDGSYRVKGEKREFETTELMQMARTEPERFSPGVMLRPVVQDFLLPTICYFGGGAEIAYFAQNSEVYRVLDRPATPIFHRQSFTVVESKYGRTLDKYNIQLTDLLDGIENVLLKAAASTMSKDSARVFAEVEDDINVHLHKLDQRLSIIDPTLAESLGKRRRKILHHITALRKKTLLSEIRQHDTANRKIENLFAALIPNGELQERTLNLISFTDRFGPNFVRWLYQSIDLEDKEHRIVYL